MVVQLWLAGWWGNDGLECLLRRKGAGSRWMFSEEAAAALYTFQLFAALHDV